MFRSAAGPAGILQGKFWSRHAGPSADRLKVARKTFVDNVCIQVIERHLVRGMPQILSPERVAGYADAELFAIAGEDEHILERRRQLQALQSSLVASLEDLRK